MSVFFRLLAQILPDQKGGYYARFDICEFIAEKLPLGNVESISDSFTLNRYFTTEKQAIKFGNYLYFRYSPYSPLPPTLNNLKLELLLEIT